MPFARAVLKARYKTWAGRVRRADYEELRESGLFDPDWYRAHNRDVAWALADPLRHYLAAGAAEGRQPFPLFDPTWYRARYPDVAASGTEPFTDFLRSGGAEGRSPSPFFDTHWYLHQNGPLDDQGLNPLIHFLVEGARLKLNPSPRFATGWYEDEYPDVPASGVNPLLDYVERGRELWRSTHPTEPPPASPVERLRDFPWSALHPGHDLPVGRRGHFKLLFVLAARLNERDRADALALLGELAGHPDLETFVITVGGGEAIRNHAATLDLGEPVFTGLDPKTVATRVAQALRDLGPLRAAILVGNDAHFAPAFERFGVGCLEWPPWRPLAPEAGALSPGQRLLAELRYEADYTPRRELSVSVIVPSFRHRAFLESRLRTIVEQTHAPTEVIFLDDASDDGSVELAEEFAARSPVPFTIIRNDQNSGSPFRQWRTGIERATGDLVWIAESDDESEPDFLEQIVPLFFDPGVAFSYAQSQVFGPDGQIYATDYQFYTRDISRSRWARSFRTSGLLEIVEALSQKNTIPNVSAAVFRRQHLAGLGPRLETFRYAGDWWTYLETARRGDVAFVARSLNRHRRPGSSLTESSEGQAGPLAESLRIKAELFREVDLPINTVHRSLGVSVHEYLLRSRRRGGSILRFTDHPAASPWLEEIRGLLDVRLADVGMLRIVLVAARDLELGRMAAAQISGLATAYLLCDDPALGEDPSGTDAELLIEGTWGAAPWANPKPGSSEQGPNHRIEVLSELARLHRIDALVSFGAAGRVLASKLAASAGLPWLAVLTRETPLTPEDHAAIEHACDGLIQTAASMAEALKGAGVAGFLDAVARAVERKSRDRARSASADAGY